MPSDIFCKPSLEPDGGISAFHFSHKIQTGNCVVKRGEITWISFRVDLHFVPVKRYLSSDSSGLKIWEFHKNIPGFCYSYSCFVEQILTKGLALFSK